MRFDFLANIIFPPVCVVCRGRIARGVVCDACFSGIEIRDSLIRNPDFPFMLGAAGHYDDKVLQSLIHNLKFRSIKGAAEPLAKLMARYIARAGIDLTGFIAVPIPLSRRRLRARGYNQSELIARKLAAILKEKNTSQNSGFDLPVATDILIRAKHAKPQSDTTSLAERMENIRGAYAIRNSGKVRGMGKAVYADTRDVHDVRGANILLIDDVCTSGATFLEAAITLKAAGAGAIIALAAAKT